mmetsp:Transcript_62190/g.116371  ORF Transcript_62190/g.116371 Transcript_62190/m.116371 type:complete len:208 (+) Transcript_62190:128-751(+)
MPRLKKLTKLINTKLRMEIQRLRQERNEAQQRRLEAEREIQTFLKELEDQKAAWNLQGVRNQYGCKSPLYSNGEWHSKGVFEHAANEAWMEQMAASGDSWFTFATTFRRVSENPAAGQFSTHLASSARQNGATSQHEVQQLLQRVWEEVHLQWIEDGFPDCVTSSDFLQIIILGSTSEEAKSVVSKLCLKMSLRTRIVPGKMRLPST